MGDSDIVGARPPPPGRAGQPVRPRRVLDAAFDQETDAAFAAIQQPGRATAPIRTGTAAAAAAAHGPSEWDDEKTRTTFMTEADFCTHAGGASQGAVPSPSHLRCSRPTTRSRPRPTRSASPRPLADPVAAGRPDRRPATPASRRWRPNGGSLLEQIEELKHRLQSQPLSKEKEFLSLREIINRKEKDILDLRDALDAKDRQILDQKDRVREHERARRDLEERMLDFEKNLMAAQERVGRPGPRQGKGHRARKGRSRPGSTTP